MPRKAGRPFDFGNLDVLKDPEQTALYLEEILAVIPNNLFCTMRSSPIALLGSFGLSWTQLCYLSSNSTEKFSYDI